MWSGFFAGILAAVAAVVSVVLGWFFNESGKVSAVRKALQLEIDANWQRLENFRKATWPGRRAEDLTEAVDARAVENALRQNPGVFCGWQRSVWNNNLVQIVSMLRAEDVKRLQDFYLQLERLDHLQGPEVYAEVSRVLFRLCREKKPEMRAPQWYDPVLSFIRVR